MARGSNLEAQTQLVIAREIGYGNPQTLKEAEDFSIEVGKMLTAILKKL
jgi:four helix bundle protein